MRTASSVTILAEDKRHQTFARRYLKRLGYRTHQIVEEAIPSGGGSGEQWVRDRYSLVVHEYRRRAVKAGTGLVVVIDADKHEIEFRQRQLNASLEVVRGDEERIAHLIPRWSIETWILCLGGKAVIEGESYRHDHRVEGCARSAPEIFHGWTRPNAAVPSHCIDSLSKAMNEARRLEA